MSEPVVTKRFVIEAGLFNRRRVVNETTVAAWELDLDCFHERAGSTIRFTVRGEGERVRRLMEQVASACGKG